ncbi:MAG: tail fiber domain-containing protein [candidate division Zixibacteria bacterium]|nr:tail fiber domain-containing protein [candidate division Zixibacteria bacterium]
MKLGIAVPNPGNILTVKQASSTDPIADAWTTCSSREYKRDIHELTPEEYREALEKVVSVPVVKFHYKGEDTKEKIGLIAEEAPEQILAEGDNKAISLNEYITLLHAALKAQQQQIGALEDEIQRMKPGGQ